jgi:putative tricarboxylic transport membrane protein
MKKDLAAGLALLALAGVYTVLTRRIPTSSLSDAVGPEGLPNLLALALGIVALALIGKSLIAMRLAARMPAAPAEGEERAGLPRALAFIGLGVGYMLLAPWLGFGLAIAVLMIATALFEGARPSFRLLWVGALVGLGFWLVFVRFLGVEQPVSRLIGG